MKLAKVSWSEMSLLTTHQLVFSADSRFSIVQDESYNWRLVIQSAQERDAASYLCQVNTHPPATLLVQLIVIGAVSLVMSGYLPSVRSASPEYSG